MIPSDKPKFAQMLMATGAAYKREISPAVAEMTFEDLKEYSLDQVAAAYKAHRLDPERGQYFPLVANVMRQIGKAQEALQGPKLDATARARLAWAEIYGKFASVGPYQTPKLEDTQGWAVVKALGGWKFLCSQTEQQLVWIEKRFIEHYETYDTLSERQIPEALPGAEDLRTAKRLEQLEDDDDEYDYDHCDPEFLLDHDSDKR